MAVLLHRSNDLPDRTVYRQWFTIGTTPAEGLDPTTKAADIASRLERAFESIAEPWLTLARLLSEAPSAALSHTASAAASVSDFGVMAAWSELVAEAAAGAETTLVVCDDPWMFRHLEAQDNVSSGTRPPLMVLERMLGLRGVMARTKVALVNLLAYVRTRKYQTKYTQAHGALLVYGHPASTVDGFDGYFGDLMQDIDDLVRILHVDCPASRAVDLAKDGRTFSLHAWGCPLDALTLPFARWRPERAHLKGPFGWLIRRAAAIEGGGGQGAMIAWQQRCQRRWLRRSAPKVVAWPWENHAWEKDFVRAAHRAGVQTIGYQHSVMGRHMFRHSPAANRDGAESLPRKILCSGQSTLDQLIEFGMTPDRLCVGGAFRFPNVGPRPYDPQGPVFIALPFDGAIADEMVGAARCLLQHGFRFIVKDHPMSPYDFEEALGLVRTTDRLDEQGGLSAVIFAATTVGLEAYLGGLSTIRFLSEGRMALDIMPGEVTLPTATSASLLEILSSVAEQSQTERPTPLPGDHFFAAVSLEIWRKELLYG